MLLVVSQDVAHQLIQHGKQSSQSPQAGVIHDVLQLIAVLQALGHQAIRREVRQEDGSTLPLQQQSGGDLLLLLVLTATRKTTVIISFFNWDIAELLQIALKDHLSAQNIFTEPNHTAATHSGQGSKLKVLYFKHDAHLFKIAKVGFPHMIKQG
jgi:hypothetical protein